MINIFIKITFLLSLVPFSVLADSSLKSDNNKKNKERVLLTAAIEEIGYAPYNYEENGAIRGFTIDVLEYFETHSNYDFEFIILPWPRALHLVAQGEVDMILTLFRNPKREKIYYFIEPSYGYEANQLFTLTDNKLGFTGKLEQLIPYSIGTKREFSYGIAFDQANYLTKLPALTEKILLKLLLAKRIDVAIANPFIFQQLMSEQNVGAKVRPIEPFVEITPVYLALTKKREDSLEIKKTLGQLTKQLKASPYYQELLNKYLLNFK